MRPDDQVAAYLWDALTRARQVPEILRGVEFADYQGDIVLTAATERHLEVIGEALRNLRRVAPEIAETIPDLHRIIGMRNVLVHGYADVNDLTVWTAGMIDVPALVPILELLLAEYGPPVS